MRLQLMMTTEIRKPARWHAMFTNAQHKDRFSAPAVMSVDFPVLGLSRAENSADRCLHLVSYAATPDQKGAQTEFRVVRVPAARSKSIWVKRDGQKYSDWSVVSADEIVIRTQVADHWYTVYTGYVGPTGV